MLQQRRHAVWSDKENGSSSTKAVSKTPGPGGTKSGLVGGGGGIRPKAATEGLKGKQRVLTAGSSKKAIAEGSNDEIEPKRLFKEALVPPTTVQRRNNLLGDKTNTSKKPTTTLRLDGGPALKPSLQLAKTPGPKKSVRLAPTTPAVGKPVAVVGRDDEELGEAFKTPAPNDRPRRPPLLIATPEEAGAGPAQEVKQQMDWGLEGGELPDVEYGPPTATQEDALELCDVRCDVDGLAGMLKGGMPLYTVDEFSGNVADLILSEERGNRFGAEPVISVASPDDGVLDTYDFIVPDPKPAANPVSRGPVFARRPLVSSLSRPRPTSAPSTVRKPAVAAARPKSVEREEAQRALVAEIEALSTVPEEATGLDLDVGLDGFRFDV